MISSHFWVNRRVFLSGHTGVEGAWLALILQRLNARVTGYGLAPARADNFYALARVNEQLCDVRGDLCDSAMLDGALRAAEPDIVIHMARLASEDDRQEAIEVLCETARNAPSVQKVVIVNRDAAPLNPSLTRSFVHDDAPQILQIRFGDLIAGGDFSQNRFSGELMSAMRRGKRLVCSNEAEQRGYIHVLDALYGLLLAIEQGSSVRGPYEFSAGPSHVATLSHLLEIAAQSATAKAAPAKIVSAHETVEMRSGRIVRPAQCDQRMAHALGWETLLTLEEAVAWTVRWSQVFVEGGDLAALSLAQVETYFGQRLRLTLPSLFKPLRRAA